VSGHLEANPKLAPVVIPGRLLNEIYTHALENYPEECCGLLTGSGPGCFDAVHRCDNKMNLRHGEDPLRHPRGGRVAFRLEPEDYVEILKEAKAAGSRVTGLYHSHVEAGAYLSEDDQKDALQNPYPFPEADHMVVSVVERVVKGVAAFRWLPGKKRFEGRRLVAEAP
jgi:proteasome lid subunit RPN8/RPN11